MRESLSIAQVNLLGHPPKRGMNIPNFGGSSFKINILPWRKRMNDDVRLPCGCWNFCDLSCDPGEPESSVLLLDEEGEDDDWDPRDDYDPEDIPGSRFDPDCEDNPM